MLHGLLHISKPAKFEQTLIYNSLFISRETHALQPAVLQQLKQFKIIQCNKEKETRTQLKTTFTYSKINTQVLKLHQYLLVSVLTSIHYSFWV